MATRNMTMVVARRHYEDFTERMMDITPHSMAEYSKVNMYLHHDGYPEWQGVQLATWVLSNQYHDPARVAAKLVHDMYYDSCYLYNDPSHIDHQYTYIVFADGTDPLIYCYDQYEDKKVFCLEPRDVINLYSSDMQYTDFAGGETRSTGYAKGGYNVNIPLDDARKIVKLITSNKGYWNESRDSCLSD